LAEQFAAAWQIVEHLARLLLNLAPWCESTPGEAVPLKARRPVIPRLARDSQKPSLGRSPDLDCFPVAVVRQESFHP